ncbi:SDR family NAD(P)-dependent oxidoreductase [Rhodococcus rhodochrous]|uniref:SDR family NAD(P)-dependent oxidoreductase n=1 Tax=Rhodococcus rhodochrous TaxID=1829 RepID=UPI001E6053BE|nr:SDR family NAD(P)-dependent oxidoreductase [Rhodococcus rhodochrous]MCD2099650.1 SDR family NAD(P)-dependent oxidoreductase [Rhodococcus rhodochrous]MCD2124018.1 SDR family NAD(P)-dependent oxidoreductase [Rhodococcus rhodochrous]MCQ4136709.1 SDR family NAD(P)-dependent oxidoreductase [Rhodococcus rhodochrous]MDJ0020772.1 SDR family NAD(P)-dependent oxidoreductase [Rhodococcus rhodochrous]
MRPEDLKDGTAVVTGAGSGIGESAARRAAALGMNVVLADISAERLDAVAADLRADGCAALTVPTDVRDAAAVDALADAAYAEFGSVTVLLNNAGLESLGYTWEVPVGEWRRVIDVNLLGVYHGIRSFVPRMGADPRRSHIVNTCSVGGIAITPRMTAYAASKHGVQALTECLYLECAEAYPQIGVSVFSPGQVATRIFDDLPDREASAADAGFWREQIREGMTPDDAARLLFDGIGRDDFWILTHPESFDRLAAKRARVLTDRLRPDALFDGRN